MLETTDNLTAPAGSPVIKPADRLVMTLCLAVIIHAVLVLGITFTNEDKLLSDYSTMEIILVQQSSAAPKEAKMLAQANLEGGGDTDEKVTPSTPLPSPFPGNQAELTTPPPSSQKVPPPKSDPDKATVVVQKNKPEMTSAKDNLEQTQTQYASEQQIKVQETLPSASTLITNSLKIAALSAAIDSKLESRAQRPRLKFISASTREFKYAAYMESWRAKVERIGNLNYPDSARQQRLSGSLILDVGVKPDGSIDEIIIRKSSGHQILDDAAIRIVELAAPYSAFPDNIKNEIDILHITRTWQFLDSRGFR